MATSGTAYPAGEADVELTIMNGAKPLSALVCATCGAQQARARIGVSGTGHAFISLIAIEQSSDGRRDAH